MIRFLGKILVMLGGLGIAISIAIILISTLTFILVFQLLWFGGEPTKPLTELMLMLITNHHLWSIICLSVGLYLIGKFLAPLRN